MEASLPGKVPGLETQAYRVSSALPRSQQGKTPRVYEGLHEEVPSKKERTAEKGERAVKKRDLTVTRQVFKKKVFIGDINC